MSTPERKIVLDASALLAWVLGERGRDTVDRLLPVAAITAANLVEVLHRAPARGHRMSPAHIHEAVVGMGLAVEPVTDADTVRAAELLAMSRTTATDGTLSLGDALCLAVAERLDLPVSGGDQLWETLDLRVRYLPFR